MNKLRENQEGGKRKEVLRNWIHSLCRSSPYGKEAIKFPQTLDILDAIEYFPVDKFRGG